MANYLNAYTLPASPSKGRPALRGRYNAGRTLPRWRKHTRAQAVAWYRVHRITKGAYRPPSYSYAWLCTKAGQAMYLVHNALYGGIS